MHGTDQVFSPAQASVYVLPFHDRVLVYAPLHETAAILGAADASLLQAALIAGQPPAQSALRPIWETLRQPRSTPESNHGPLSPKFLGLLPTRACNFRCRYCGFMGEPGALPTMSLDLARQAVTWYLDLVADLGENNATIHFFGGEPLCAPDVLDLVIPLGRRLGQERGVSVSYSVTTNGGFSERRAHWVADHIDSLILSLDGPPDIQDFHRPRGDGSPSADMVMRTARIASRGNNRLYLRSCVTDRTVERMPEIAAWFCETFAPAGVCFEPVQPEGEGGTGDLLPPDPWQFARGFLDAGHILDAYGVEQIHAAAAIGQPRVSFCPVGYDAVIVSPDGRLSGCYLMQKEWEAYGLDMDMGWLRDGTACVDSASVERLRALNVRNQPACERCFCRWTCAGACHVHHTPEPDRYNRLCTQTRLLTLGNLLKAIGRQDLLDALWAYRADLERAIHQVDDRFLTQQTPAVPS